MPTKPAEPSGILMISVQVDRLTINVVTKVFECSNYRENFKFSRVPLPLVLRSRP